MQVRMKSPVMVVPDVMRSLLALAGTVKKSTIPETTLALVDLRASQINGCGRCVEMHADELKEAGEPDERIFAVAAWHDSSRFTDAERAALALTEAATRMSDRTDAVPDAVWQEATRHYDEQALASLVLKIALINFWNRVNVTTRQLPLQTRKQGG